MYHFSKEIVYFKSNQAIKMTASPRSVKEDGRANADTVDASKSLKQDASLY